MADRKQFDNVPTPNPELMRLLANGRAATEEELQEQRISFAFGNAPIDADSITKESVRIASNSISILR
ncbi:MAG: hypothetical protein ACRD3W_15630 [Terriglobales bacterium]|jgi:hypothetical protein